VGHLTQNTGPLHACPDRCRWTFRGPQEARVRRIRPARTRYAKHGADPILGTARLSKRPVSPATARSYPPCIPRRGKTCRKTDLSRACYNRCTMRLILTAPSQYQEEIRKSRFLAQAVPLSAPNEAPALLQQLSAPSATHNCWAWAFG